MSRGPNTPSDPRKENPLRGSEKRDLLFVATPLHFYPPDTTTPMHTLLLRLSREAEQARELADLD